MKKIDVNLWLFNVKNETLEENVRKWLITYGYGNYHHNLISQNEVEISPNEKVFINMHISGYFEDKYFYNFTFRTINSKYGSRSQKFDIFSKKTKNVLNMTKKEFMENLEKIAKRSKDEWKIKLLNNKNYQNALWTIYSKVTKYYLKTKKVVDIESKKCFALKKGA